jgi:integrase/recombinase XerD
MDRNSSGSLILDKAITGFISYKMAEGLSQRSIVSYEWILRKWAVYTGEIELNKIASQDITGYLSWLRNDYVPRRFNGKKHPLSPKTIRNVWIALSAFFSWAKQELKLPNPMADVPVPRYKKTPVQAFSQEEVEKILKACAYSRESNTNTRHKFVMRRPTANRDYAIILILLDTGLRALELCSVKIGDVDIKSGKVEIKHGDEGGAKGGKGRTVYLGKASHRALWRYLAEREDGENHQSPVFVSRDDRPFCPDTLRQLVKSIAERAGVPNAYPHKFRHTFAITYLRSGGDVFTLQALLGHSSLDMVRHYASIADIDVANAHRRASPADNWRL